MTVTVHFFLAAGNVFHYHQMLAVRICQQFISPIPRGSNCIITNSTVACPKGVPPVGADEF